jgi:hypothetical protein
MQATSPATPAAWAGQPNPSSARAIEQPTSGGASIDRRDRMILDGISATPRIATPPESIARGILHRTALG